jgi:hypothetical protein
MSEAFQKLAPSAAGEMIVFPFPGTRTEFAALSGKGVTP